MHDPPETMPRGYVKTTGLSHKALHQGSLQTLATMPNHVSGGAVWRGIVPVAALPPPVKLTVIPAFTHNPVNLHVWRWPMVLPRGQARTVPVSSQIDIAILWRQRLETSCRPCLLTSLVPLPPPLPLLTPLTTSRACCNVSEKSISESLHIDGYMQYCGNSSALVMELPLSCTKPLVFLGFHPSLFCYFNLLQVF